MGPGSVVMGVFQWFVVWCVTCNRCLGRCESHSSTAGLAIPSQFGRKLASACFSAQQISRGNTIESKHAARPQPTHRKLLHVRRPLAIPPNHTSMHMFKMISTSLLPLTCHDAYCIIPRLRRPRRRIRVWPLNPHPHALHPLAPRRPPFPLLYVIQQLPGPPAVRLDVAE